jgi:hypothetical protein
MNKIANILSVAYNSIVLMLNNNSYVESRAVMEDMNISVLFFVAPIPVLARITNQFLSVNFRP